MAKTILTQSRLKELLHYDPYTGCFTWRVRKNQCSEIGSVAGTQVCGYVSITLDRKKYQAHRLAWLYIYGELPANDVDHINRTRADNRITNLRLATRSENMQNQAHRKTNTSGHIGVVWYERYKKWQAQIRLNCRCIYLGRFTEIADAIAARKAGELKYHLYQNPSL